MKPNNKRHAIINENEVQERLGAREAKRLAMEVKAKEPGCDTRLQHIDDTNAQSVAANSRMLELPPQITEDVSTINVVAKQQVALQFGGGATLVPEDLAEDMYQYQRSQEEEMKLPTNFLDGKLVDSLKRQSIIDWLYHVQLFLGFLPETMSLTIYLLDKSIIQMDNISKYNLQLLGVSCFLTASKFEEVNFVSIDDLIAISQNDFSKEEVILMEQKILECCGFELAYPNYSQFLRRFRFYFGIKHQCVYKLSKYFCEVAALIYELAHEKPSVIAASALFLASAAYNLSLPSKQILADQLGKDFERVLPIALFLVQPSISFISPSCNNFNSLKCRYEKTTMKVEFLTLCKYTLRHFALLNGSRVHSMSTSSALHCRSNEL